MRELFIKFLYWTLPADRQLFLRMSLKEPSLDSALQAQANHYKTTDEVTK
jgi:hypothetical protein